MFVKVSLTIADLAPIIVDVALTILDLALTILDLALTIVELRFSHHPRLGAPYRRILQKLYFLHLIQSLKYI